MKDVSVLLAAHFYCDELMEEFYKLQDAVGENCFILYHYIDGKFLDDRIFTMPHFITTKQSLGKLGYPPLFKKDSLAPGSNHFALIDFSRTYPSEFYWYIEYDVRFTGNWKNLFDYFKDDADILTAHIRRYEEEQNWYWWNALYHPSTSIGKTDKLRSFNPIYRISVAAIKHIDKMHKSGWMGHQEVLMPTLLHKDGFKLRDFGGSGNFVRPEDKERYYTDSTSHLLTDGTLCYRNLHVGYEKVRDKIFHPIKGNG